ncbi:hypothetical protein P43SY_008250 [Pythium insidiosum]|uniref:Uncharacterized protein n=1 Tax=Pythium insidiosum TaxID=114742 RepID=A0AAD5LIE9_PYTIN|nr:hypothetical protein P43SY_008250 [Pythium insidiosum]
MRRNFASLDLSALDADDVEPRREQEPSACLDAMASLSLQSPDDDDALASSVPNSASSPSMVGFPMELLAMSEGDDDDDDHHHNLVERTASARCSARPSAPRSVLPAIRPATNEPVPSVAAAAARPLSTPASKLATATCSQSPPVRVAPLGAAASLRHRNVIQSV